VIDVHEMSLMSSIFEIINDTIKVHQPKKVTRVTLKVGELTNALPEALEMAFEVFSRETIVEGAELEIIRVPIKVHCSECGQDSIVEERRFICSNCESIVVSVTQGRELQLDSLEVE
jgi:hydrogenase nickel incorporation protein HypA/HybF